MEGKKALRDSGFVIYYLFLGAGALLLLSTEKGEILLWINSRHNAFLDFFFKYWTHLGDGF